jgi:hypothetical protein
MRDEQFNRVQGYVYALSNVAVLVAMGIYALLKSVACYSEARANITMLGLAAAAHCIDLGLWAMLWPLFMRLYTQHERHVQDVARQHWDDAIGRQGWWPGLRAMFLSRAFWTLGLFMLVLLFAEVPSTAVELALPNVMRAHGLDEPAAADNNTMPGAVCGWGALVGDSTLFTVVQMINPAVVIAFTVPIQLALAARSGYTVIAAGALLSSAGLLFPVVADHSLWTLLLFLLTYSLAECVWSARMNAYVMSVAPANRQSTYLAMGSVPKTLGRVALRALMGALVDAYCPASASAAAGGGDGCSARPIWGYALLASLLTPVLLVIFRSRLEPAPRPLLPEPATKS